MLRPNFPPVVARQVAVSGIQISAEAGRAFVDNLAAFTANNSTYWKLLESGSATQANSKISGAVGVAFYDTGAGTDLTANLGKYLVVKDSTGKAIKGWIKAAGSAETLGSELITSITSRPDPYLWETLTVNANGKDIDSAVNTHNTAALAYTNTFNSAGALVKISTDLNMVSTPYLPILYTKKNTNSIQRVLLSKIPSGANNFYTTYVVGDNGLSLYTVDRELEFSLVWSAKQVLTPSSTGCTITSTKNGTTFDWESQETGFNYNDTSGYTYQVYDRDLSAFCDNSHSISFYDTNGACIEGVGKEVGTEETLSAVIRGE